LAPDLEADAHLDFGESVREFRHWYDRVGGPRDAESDIVGLETSAPMTRSLSAMQQQNLLPISS
jgi:hypothetical protein